MKNIALISGLAALAAALPAPAIPSSINPGGPFKSATGLPFPTLSGGLPIGSGMPFPTEHHHPHHWHHHMTGFPGPNGGSFSGFPAGPTAAPSLDAREAQFSGVKPSMPIVEGSTLPSFSVPGGFGGGKSGGSSAEPTGGFGGVHHSFSLPAGGESGAAGPTGGFGGAASSFSLPAGGESATPTATGGFGGGAASSFSFPAGGESGIAQPTGFGGGAVSSFSLPALASESGAAAPTGAAFYRHKFEHHHYHHSESGVAAPTGFSVPAFSGAPSGGFSLPVPTGTGLAVPTTTGY